MGTTADADQQCEAIARCLDHAVSKKGNVIVPSITGRVYLHSTRMKENQSSNLRGVISGGLDQVRVPSLRPIVAERDSDHDQRADCDYHRADQRQRFQHADNDRPDAVSSLHMREAPACHTHRPSPFGPQQRRSDSRTRSVPDCGQFACSLDQGEGTLALLNSSTSSAFSQALADLSVAQHGVLGAKVARWLFPVERGIEHRTDVRRKLQQRPLQPFCDLDELVVLGAFVVNVAMACGL